MYVIPSTHSSIGDRNLVLLVCICGTVCHHPWTGNWL